MMRKSNIALTALMLAASPALAQQGAAERLVSPALPGFVIGYNAANAQQSIVEEVPRGESLQAWTRMVTTQRFAGLARRATVGQYAQNVMNAVPRSCPGARVSPLVNLRVSGREAVRFQLDCPRSVGGRPETFILLAIAGPSDIHVKQVAWRGGTTPAGLAWGQQHLAATALCLAGDRTPACR
jgi:hypothetical protein